jgi:hypothetical protein
VLLSLFGFPFLWLLLFPGVEQQPPAFILYSGMVLGLVGLGVAVGLWMMKAWSLWASIVVCVLNFLLGAPSVVMAPVAAPAKTLSWKAAATALRGVSRANNRSHRTPRDRLVPGTVPEESLVYECFPPRIHERSRRVST